MSRCVCLCLLVFAVLIGASADPPKAAEPEVSLTTSFKDGSLKGFTIEGVIPQRKEIGGVVMLPDSALGRMLPMGVEAEIQTDVVFAKDLGDGAGTARAFYLVLRGGYNMNRAGVFMALEDGKLSLSSIAVVPKVKHSLAAPGVDPAGPWTLKVRVRYGVVQAKAWPQGKPEPKDWQITFFSGYSGWEPVGFMLYPEKGAAIGLQRLEVRGTKPTTDYFLKVPNKIDAEVVQLVKQMLQTEVLRKEGDLKKAAEHASECFETAKKLFGLEHALTTMCLYDVADTLYEAGSYDDALKAYQDAHKIAEKVLPANHPHIARCKEGVALTLVAKGDWDKGEKMHREVLDYCREVLGEDHPSTGFAWNCLGLVLGLQAEHKKALECMENALKVRKAVFGNHPETAQAHNNLAQQLAVMGEYQAALPHYESAIKIAKDTLGAEHPVVSIIEHNYAFLLQSMGRLKDAQVLYERSVVLLKKAGGEKHPLLVRTLAMLGVVAIERGDYVTARIHFEDAHKLCKETLGPNHPETLEREYFLAMLYLQLDEPEGARLYNHSVKLLLDKLPTDHPTLALILDEGTRMGQGGKSDDKELLEDLEKVLTIRRTKLGESHPYTLDTTNKLALARLRAGKTDEAEKMLAAAFATCRDKLGAGHPSTSLTRHSLGIASFVRGKYSDASDSMKLAAEGLAKTHGRQNPLVAEIRSFQALALLLQGKRTEALASAAEAMTGYDLIRKLLDGTPEAQHAAIAAMLRSEARIFFSLAASEPEKLEGHGLTLFRTAMDWKATSGRAMLDRLEAMTVKQLPEAVEKHNKLLDERRALVRGIMRGPGGQQAEKYAEALEEARKRVEKLEQELAQLAKGYAEVAQARGASPAVVAKRIPANGALIEFVYLEEFQFHYGKPKGIAPDASYLALVVTPKAGTSDPDVKLVPLGNAMDIEETIKNWRKDVDTKKRNPVSEEALREQLWDPIAKVLPANTKRLFIAPAGQIALIPFEAIWADDAFLIEKYLISYCSTGRDLIPRPVPAGELGESVVVADPDFNHIPADAKEVKNVAPAGAVSALAFQSNPPKEDELPGFAKEADAVTKLLEAKFPGRVKTLRRREATEENLLSVSRPRLLYLITHGNFLTDQKQLATLEGRPVAPQQETSESWATPRLGHLHGEDPRLRSYLCLAGYNRWKERLTRTGSDGKPLSDGILTAREVETLDLWGTDLVVTAACKTGVGHVQVGEGVLGLRRAFQQAGARTVVTSLWSVPDEQTAVLLPRFLSDYLAGTPKAEALRKSQLTLIAELRKGDSKKPKYQASPFFWAAFVCHGLPE